MRPLPPILAFALVLLCGAAEPSVVCRGAWARPGFKGGTDAVYLTLVNRSASPDRLVAVESPAAASASLHETRIEAGISRMRPVAFVPLPPHASVAFAPGGLHIMLIGLRRSLTVGDKAPVVLVLTGRRRIATDAVVRAGPPSMPAMRM